MISRDRRRRGTSKPEGLVRRWWRFAVGLSMIALALLPVAGQDDPSASPEARAETAEPPPPKAPAARIVSLHMPLTTGAEGDKAIAQIEAAVARLPKLGATRPLLILEFLSTEGSAAEGTEFEAALKVARTLTGEKLSGVRTVAFLPRSIKGHGVLPVIACDEIIMASQAEFGAAGINETEIGPVLRASYEEIADRRRTIPKALALAMLDRRHKLLKVQTLEGSRVVLDTELEELKQATTISAEKTLKAEGDLAVFTGAAWRHELGYVSHLASERRELAEALKLSLSALDDNPLAAQEANAVRINFSGPVNSRLVDRTQKILADQLKSDDINLIILWIRSEGGSLEEAVDLAQSLNHVDPKQTRTVAYVSDLAHGAAAVIALACDELVMEEGAVLGGDGIGTLSGPELARVTPLVREIMQRRDRSWSPALALAGDDTPIRRFVNARTGEKRLMSDAELGERKDREDWTTDLEAVQLSAGLGASEAVEHGLAQHRAVHFDEVKAMFRIDSDIKTAQVNWALALIERLADRRLSGLLLFIGTFALFSELSQPGLGVPGFIAGVCFLLFFWANFLHGNADLLELLLFVAGVICVLMEVFVVPGAMVFGVGGALLIVVSVVLASQTFVLPTNYYQLQQVPGSLMMVAVAGIGGLAGMIVLQRFLPHTPYFKRLILQPPIEEEAAELQQRERIASFDYLIGKRGISLTPLVPAGKAQFGDEVVDVISDGPLVEVGSEVTVIEAFGSRIRVRPVEG